MMERIKELQEWFKSQEGYPNDDLIADGEWGEKTKGCVAHLTGGDDGSIEGFQTWCLEQEGYPNDDLIADGEVGEKTDACIDHLIAEEPADGDGTGDDD